jgi:MFS family permease
MLTDIIPPEWRGRVYAIFAALGAALGAVQVVYIVTDTSQPVWLTAALAVLAFVGTAIGAVAKANVNPPAVPQHALPVEPSVTANADGTVTSVAVDGTVTKV